MPFWRTGKSAFATALLDAVRAGDAATVGDLLARGNAARPALSDALGLAIELRHEAVVRRLLDHGADPDGGLEHLTLHYDRALLRLLLDHGADIHRLGSFDGYHDDPLSLRDPTGAPALEGFIADAVAAGWRIEDLDPFEEHQIRFVIGSHRIAEQDITAPDFTAPARRFAGTANPEEATAPLHLESLRSGAGPHGMRARGIRLPRPCWTAVRFGQSTTPLPDGRWIQIGGEHEDSYDPDFVIFSDVVVQEDRGARVFLYPTEVFPPTDFHSATLTGGAIWIIGSTGHPDQRRAGHVPVFRLSLADFSISTVETGGETPGWISRHSARLADGGIILSGGWIWTGTGFEDNPASWRLDTATLRWSRLPA